MSLKEGSELKCGLVPLYVLYRIENDHILYSILFGLLTRK